MATTADTRAKITVGIEEGQEYGETSHRETEVKGLFGPPDSEMGEPTTVKRHALPRGLSKMTIFREPKEVEPRSGVDAAFSLVYVVLLVLFTAKVIIDHVGRPSVESVRLEVQSKSDIPPIPVSVEVRCSADWLCNDSYDGTTTPDAREWVTFESSYAHGRCPSIPRTAVTTAFSEASFETTLCYSADYLNHGLDIRVPFDSAYVGQATYVAGLALNVKITTPKSTMFVDVDLELSQRKTIFISQWVDERNERTATAVLDEIVGMEPDTKIIASSQEPFQADLYYDGKNANTTALLRVRASQYASVKKRQKEGSWVEVLALVGGAHSLLWISLLTARNSVLLSLTSSSSHVGGCCACVMDIFG